MSIYFLHFLNAFLPVSLFMFFFARGEKFYRTLILILAGATFGYFGYKISLTIQGGLKNLYLYTNIIYLLIFVLFWIFALKFKGAQIVKFALIFALGFVSSTEYFYISNGFAIFAQKLLDSISVNNLALILSGFVISIAIFFTLKFARQILANRLFFGVAGASFLLINAFKFIAEILLFAMKKGAINPDLANGLALSFISRMKYYSHFFTYIYILFFVLCAILLLMHQIKNVQKKGILDIKFRQNLAYNSEIKNNVTTILLSSIFILGVYLYFDLYASKPLQIDEPIIVEPNSDGEFVFDTKELADNKLHRYAYITDEGKTIRFFLISKYKDRVVPVAVFDSCMICGDKGYIKKGDELICISCNVRIFSPSVGKPGGCNPIPFNFLVENDTLKIPLKEITQGANYFSEIREKVVIDPVSKKELINLDAKFNYIFGDKTYFFESEENKEKFIKDPEKYGAKLNSAYFRVQGHH